MAQPMPTCADAENRCVAAGYAVFSNSSCTGIPIKGTNKPIRCGYMMGKNDLDNNECWAQAAPTEADCPSVMVCSGSWCVDVFPTFVACLGDSRRAKDPNAGSRAKSRASSLRTVHTNGTVEATLTLPAAPKLSGGSAELIDGKSGATVSSAPVTASGKKVTAVLDASAVPGGYYTVRVVLINKDGGRSAEEASIGIVK
jgi:hypothetical protein